MGAITSLAGSIETVRDESVLRKVGVTEAAWDGVYRAELAELGRRERLYRKDMQRVEVGGRVTIVVDDGIATGSTMRAALAALEKQNPDRTVVATPVASPETCWELEDIADEVVCLARPSPLRFIGKWYTDFGPVGDEEVSSGLAAAAGL